LETSETNSVASPPDALMSAATRSPRALSRSTMAILAPSAANSFAISSPMLRPAPVTIATWSFNFIVLVPLIAANDRLPNLPIQSRRNVLI
jgi:hypothetical protein